MIRRLIFALLSRLSPYRPPSAGLRSLRLSIVNTTRKS